MQWTHPFSVPVNDTVGRAGCQGFDCVYCPIQVGQKLMAETHIPHFQVGNRKIGQSTVASTPEAAGTGVFESTGIYEGHVDGQAFSGLNHTAEGRFGSLVKTLE
jgi:hypothetical protein